MKYIPSVNIEHNQFDKANYIVTPNALGVVGNIVNAFNTGMHSFNVIGSYGTGKSSFLLALEDSLAHNSDILISNNGQFNQYKKFKFCKLVGDYISLQSLLMNHLFPNKLDANLFDCFDDFFKEAEKKKEFVFIFIDEFGKLLEYAAKNNPEKELYLFQQVTEYINSPKRNVILITTLHQNFNAYARALSESQRNEWNKVKGRFKEIVFNEPVEQLLFLAEKHLEGAFRKCINPNFSDIYKLAQKTKYINSSIKESTAIALYPLDIFAAQALTLSIQRYGQNERSLFSFLESVGLGSLKDFRETESTTYSLADVCDYDTYNFHSFLSEPNSDTSLWTGLKVAIERVETLYDAEQTVIDATKLVKSIAMINLFGNAGVAFDKDDLVLYASCALGINDAATIIDELVQHKIIRYAIYKSQYMLFEGTDINIEGELLKASSIVPRSKDIVDKLNSVFDLPYEFANAVYFKKGTPRYFEYIISEGPIFDTPKNEVDGFINLIFNEDLNLSKLKAATKEVEEAIIYVFFNNADEIIDHVWMMDKLSYVQRTIDSMDKVAQKEVHSLLAYEKLLLHNSVMNTLFGYSDAVTWLYKGKEVKLKDKSAFNKFLSTICEEVYYKTPTFKNELINKHKPSSVMSSARHSFLLALLDHSKEENLGFEKNMFKPEKTLYLTLLEHTKMHKLYFDSYELGEPEDDSFKALWNVSEEFLNSTKEKIRKISEFMEILRKKPFKLKEGFIELWVFTFLIIKKNEYSLFSDKDVYVPILNVDVLEIMRKYLPSFSIKAFNVEGIKLDIYNRYREVIGQESTEDFGSDSLVETIRPFLLFYNKLNPYAKRTRNLKKTTIQFREALANATDPEKTFFEDLPKALGFKDTDIASNDEVLRTYTTLLQDAIRDLRSCYANLIKRVELRLIEHLGLISTDYSEYKLEIQERYSVVKEYLLDENQKSLLSRILLNSGSRGAWIESLSYVILGKQLSSILDEEESYLMDNLLYGFTSLDKACEVSKMKISPEDHFMRVELISNEGSIEPQVVHVNKEKASQAKSIESKILEALSGSDDLDLYALLSVLKRRIDEKEG